MTDGAGEQAQLDLGRDRWRFSQVLLPAFLFVAVPLAVIALSRIDKIDRRHWDLSLPWSLAEFHTTNAMRFAEEATIATEGRVRITVHPGAVLGIKGPDSLRAAEDGIVPLVEMAGFQQIGSEPLLGLESLPFLVDTQDELAILYRYLRPAIDAAFARHGLKLIYVVPWPNQNLYAKRRIDRFADLAGIRIRTQDANTTELMARLGMAPVQMPSPDVVPALAAGAIDATVTSTTTGAAQKYWEFLHYIYRTNHIWVSNMLVANGDAWARLDAADRAAIEALATDLEPSFWAVSAADDQKQLKLLVEHGVEVVTPSPEMLAEMRAVARPMWRAFAERVPQARPILEAYLAATGRPPLAAAEGT